MAIGQLHRMATGSIGARLQLATCVAVLAVFGLLAGGYLYESDHITQNRVGLLRTVVQSAAAVCDHFETAERSGQMTRAAAQQAAIEAIKGMRYGTDGYLYITDLQPRMVMHPFKPALDGTDVSNVRDPEGKALFAVGAHEVAAHGSGILTYMWPFPGKAEPVPKMTYVQGFAPWGWVIGSGLYIDDLIAAKHRMALLLGGIGIGTAVVVGLVTWLLGRSVTRPTQALTRVTERLCAGDLHVAIPGASRRDELGALAKALEVLAANGRERVRLERVAADEGAARDRRQAAMDQHTREFGDTVSAILQRLAEAARNMQETSAAMSEGTERTRRSAAETADGATASSRDLSTVASATVQMSASVDEIGRQVTQAIAATQQAVTQAAQTDTTFIKLAQMAEQIGSVGETIANIAAQTNLLALNATIEAARAGDAGKGFAVVAHEVKALAAETAKATAQITDHVDAIKGATDQTAAAIRDVGTAIGRIDAVAAAIATAVEQQGAVTREIASTTQSVAVTGDRTSAAMTEVAGIADRTGTMSHSLLAAAQELGGVAETLRQEVADFFGLMAHEDSFRRRYDRISGHDSPATVMAPDQPPVEAQLHDISRAGAALRTAWQAAPGTAIRLRLPGSTDPLEARVVRQTDGLVAVAFGRDEPTVQRLEAVIDYLGRRFQVAQAA
jgi:methyl-accepting chemotaxis protein